MNMPTTQSESTAPTHTSIHADTMMGPATLAVADAERSLRFYRDLLGLQVVRHTDAQIDLGVGQTTLLHLHVQPGLRSSPRAATGLYHAAILLPTRRDLAQVLRRLLEARYPIGASDHLVSEALYLDDPDANGLEIYRDRPRSEWRYQPDGFVAMNTLPLDLANVLEELKPGDAPWHGMPAGTRIGHMHLRVGNIAQARIFYVDTLGFDLMTTYPGALFVSAGGYHHHLGLNIWESNGAAPAPPNTAGLRSFVVELPNAEALNDVRTRLAAASLPTHDHDGTLSVEDPWKNTIVFEIAA